MSYSKSKKAIRRVESYLQQMLTYNTKVEIPSEDSKTLAYRLFEGIKTSAKFANESPYSEYARLSAKFIIKTRPGKVIIEPRDAALATNSAAFAQINIPRMTTALQIIGAAIERKGKVMYFPDASLDAGMYDRLCTWANNNGYIVVGGTKEITLTKLDEK